MTLSFPSNADDEFLRTFTKVQTNRIRIFKLIDNVTFALNSMCHICSDEGVKNRVSDATMDEGTWCFCPYLLI